MNLHLDGIDLKTINYVFNKHRDAFWINTAPRIYFLIQDYLCNGTVRNVFAMMLLVPDTVILEEF